MDLKILVRQAFKNAYQVRSNGKLGNSNTLRSAKFVSEVANLLHSEIGVAKDIKLCVQQVDDQGYKNSGEWLLDIVISRTTEIRDPEIGHSKAFINSKILWAVESESAVGLPDFAADFGKLMVVKSEKYLYLNGLRPNLSDTKTYISRRLKTAEQILLESGIKGELYLGFWPSPAKDVLSGWDSENEETLINKIELFMWNGASFDRK